MEIKDVASELVRKALEPSMGFLGATYRVQLTKNFNFYDAASIIPYLNKLGMTHLYCSPILRASDGSTHGYDVVDHGQISPDLGGIEGFKVLVDTLKSFNMGLLLDIVPNHMGVATNDNRLWNDLLEHGRFSVFTGHFDIRWEDDPSGGNKLLLPILGGPYQDELKSKKVSLALERSIPMLAYHSRRLPLCIPSWRFLLSDIEISKQDEEYLKKLVGTLDDISALISSATQSQPSTEAVWKYQDLASRWANEYELCCRNTSLISHLQEQIHKINEGKVTFAARLPEIIDQQFYRLIYWKLADSEINYRRFFAVPELAALSMENDSAMAEAHSLVLKLAAQGNCGLRVDHPDGLSNPEKYFSDLQKAYLKERALILRNSETKQLVEGDSDELLTEFDRQLSLLNDASSQLPLYVIAEKILAHGEEVPRAWQIHGTTGYEFLTAVNSLFMDTAQEGAFTALYNRFTGGTLEWQETLHESKRLVLDSLLFSELRAVSTLLWRLSRALNIEVSLHSLTVAVRETAVYFPVYRTYISDGFISSSDRHIVESAVKDAQAFNVEALPEAFRFLENMLLGKGFSNTGEEIQQLCQNFIRRFEQLTAPVSAKGGEDTAFYRYCRLLSLNEVGGEPGRFGISVPDFHEFQRKRAEVQPLGLSCLSTHDTKRSEDVRAVLNVLSEIPDRWDGTIHTLRELTKSLGIQLCLSKHEEYYFYQSLIAGYPLSTDGEEGFGVRLREHMRKALREAKVNSSWRNPNEEHERYVNSYIEAFLNENELIRGLRNLQKHVQYCGFWNSLCQVVIKFTAPGVPDTYQGTESWDFSFTDPDNRRPVDFTRLQSLLRDIDGVSNLEGLADSLEDGRLKIALTQRLACLRQQLPELFRHGDYHPLVIGDSGADQLVGFMRSYESQHLIVVVGRFFTKFLNKSGGIDIDSLCEGSTTYLPGLNGQRATDWYNLLTEQRLATDIINEQIKVPIRRAFGALPFCVLCLNVAKE